MKCECLVFLLCELVVELMRILTSHDLPVPVGPVITKLCWFLTQSSEHKVWNSALSRPRGAR